MVHTQNPLTALNGAGYNFWQIFKTDAIARETILGQFGYPDKSEVKVAETKPPEHTRNSTTYHAAW